MFSLHEALAQATVTRDEVDGRVYGWLPGVVTDVDTNLMRVKARIGKMEDGDSSDWLVPMGMGSIESVPEVGDPVGVCFLDGDPHAGAYFYFPQSTTNGRPTKEPIPLGLTLVGMMNYLVTQFNQLKADFNNHGHSPGTFTTATGGPVTGVSAAAKAIAASLVSGAVGNAVTATSAADGNKGKASDGSVVPDKSTSEIVLSKRSKVR